MEPSRTAVVLINPLPEQGAIARVLEVVQGSEELLPGDAAALIPVEDLGDLYTESGQTLQGSFSAVSKPIFATKYSLESSRRDLHNALLRTVL